MNPYDRAAGLAELVNDEEIDRIALACRKLFGQPFFTVPPPAGWITVVFRQARLAVALKDCLEENGFRLCAIPACNCGWFHQTDRRPHELASMLLEASTLLERCIHSRWVMQPYRSLNDSSDAADLDNEIRAFLERIKAGAA